MYFPTQKFFQKNFKKTVAHLRFSGLYICKHFSGGASNTCPVKKEAFAPTGHWRKDFFCRFFAAVKLVVIKITIESFKIQNRQKTCVPPDAGFLLSKTAFDKKTPHDLPFSTKESCFCCAKRPDFMRKNAKWQGAVRVGGKWDGSCAFSTKS